MPLTCADRKVMGNRIFQAQISRWSKYLHKDKECNQWINLGMCPSRCSLKQTAPKTLCCIRVAVLVHPLIWKITNSFVTVFMAYSIKLMLNCEWLHSPMHTVFGRANAIDDDSRCEKVLLIFNSSKKLKETTQINWAKINCDVAKLCSQLHHAPNLLFI